MSGSIRLASVADLPALLELMRGYCEDDGLGFDAARSEATMARLLREPQWGCVLLLEREGTAIAYLALCLGYSLELGGNDAFIDELYVMPEFRGRGFGRQLMQAAAMQAKELGVQALHLEVDRLNEGAQSLYAALGFHKRDRYFLMTKSL